MKEHRTIKQQHIAVSATLNIIRKACMIAFPLITYAYATRVLGTEGIGIYEFAQSIVSYFAIVAALGISQYAVRDGAAYLGEYKQIRESHTDGALLRDNGRLSDFVSEVFSINVVMTIISYASMVIMVLFVPLLNSYMAAILIYGVSILFTTLGVDWINSLFEDYMYLTIRYIVVSVIAIVALFIFVKSPQDLYIYIAISIFATVANGILNFVYIRRFVNLRFTFNLNLAKHALPIFILFCNNIASVIYLNSDVTILRILTDDKTVGLYGVAAKVYNMIKELINAAIFVMIPRFSMYVAESGESCEDIGKGSSDISRYLLGLRNLLSPLTTALVPACVGLFFLAENVVYIVAGEHFLGGAIALKILSIAMFFAVMACFTAYAIIMPYKLERYFLVATSIAAAINIILNIVLIPMIGMPAAALTTLLAEIMVFIMLIMVASKKVRITDIVIKKDLISTIVGSVFVAAVCIVAKKVVMIGSLNIIATLCTVLVALVIYTVVCAIMGNSAVKMAVGLIKGRLGR